MIRNSLTVVYYRFLYNFKLCLSLFLNFKRGNDILFVSSHFFNMFVFFLALLLSSAHGQLVTVNDSVLEQWNLDSQGFDNAERITMESHPITNPAQLTHWTLGTLYRLPADASNCSYDSTPTAVVPVTIRTSLILGQKSAGYSCWVTEHYEAWTLYFFGHHYKESKVSPIPINETECRELVISLRDPSGNQLQRMRWDYWSTNLTNEISFKWPVTVYSTIRNYHIRLVNVSVSLDDYSTIQVHNVDFEQPCTFQDRACPTANNKGIVIWPRGIAFGGKMESQIRQYTHQVCLLSSSSLRCIESGIAIANMFEPFRCGHRMFFVRLALTSDSNDLELNQQNDFAPFQAEFSTLFEATQMTNQSHVTMLATQFNMCPSTTS